ncbi:rRNA maturation RNase YbeY [Pararhizobium haloflavum]|uniref:rRNA maturation RNase YbeY n=1 Tax=Pararhizobium haloflavum TaxID=2037914 RepID=UPI000C180670|nr:rRNA maturation RNase YbeY [Pararhizobium haloflavum]
MAAASTGIDIQIAIESEGWPLEAELGRLCDKVLAAAAVYLERETGQQAPETPPELSLLFTDDEAMRAINGEWRGKDKATNVLSFPAFPIEPGAPLGPMLGDIVFARQTIASEAKDLGLSFDDHLAHLLVHGYLHLVGYDHVDADDADLMECHETRILATLGVSDPYGDSDPR